MSGDGSFFGRDSRRSARAGQLPQMYPNTSSDYSVLIESFQAQEPHGTLTKQASGSGLGFQVRVVAVVTRSRKQSHRRQEKSLRTASLLTKP